MAEEVHPLSYYQSLSVEELHLEIDREIQLLAGFRDQLTEALQRRDEIRWAMEKEATITELEELQRDREARIQELTREISELQNKIREEKRRIEVTRRRIETLESDLPVTATRSNYFRLMRRIRDFREILRRYPPPSPATRISYQEQINDHLRWMRAIRELITLYGRLGGYTSAISRWSDIITSLHRRIAQYQRWQRVRVETTERLTRLRVELKIWIDEITSLRVKITVLEAEITKKKTVLPPILLVRIKIRLYNMARDPTPSGMFQGFFDVDAVLDPDTGVPDWEWWLTQEEIAIAKYHFVGYFKGMAKWRTPDQVTLAYFDDAAGIPDRDQTTQYKRKRDEGDPYTKRVPSGFIARAQMLTVGELIVGESSVDPEPNLDPGPDTMGIYSERFMIIGRYGVIIWDEVRERWIWRPTDEMVERVKEELKT